MRFLITLCLLMSVHTKAWAVLENVYGPKSASAGLLVKKTSSFSFAAANRNGAVLLITNGDGKNLVLQTCSGNLLQKLVCAAGNLLVSLKAELERPSSVEFSLNGRVIVTSSQLKQMTGSLQIPVTLAASNQLTIKLGNLPTQYLSFSIRAEAAPVNRPPLAEFNFTPGGGRAPLPVSFNALASLDPDLDPLVDYIWNFGDGTVVHGGALIDHTYQAGGEYQISLTVVDNKGAQGSITKSIVVTSIQPPLASLAILSEMPAIAPAMVLFSGEESTDADGVIRRYIFDFGDGTSAQSTRAQIVHEYAVAGQYTATLTVVSTSGLTSQASIVVEVVDPEILPSFSMRMIRLAALTGQVLDQDGRPLSGVIVSLKEQPELGQTLSREDGSFRLTVNAAAESTEMTVVYERSGYFDIQRKMMIGENESLEAEMVVMTRPSSEVTSLALNASAMQTAVGSISDQRRVILALPSGTSAKAWRADGSSQTLLNASIRVTEFLSEPARQVASDAWSLAISTDEGLALNASRVEFSQPIAIYMDQSSQPLNLSVPSLDSSSRSSLSSSPLSAGRSITLMSVQNGLAVLDVSGSGQAASARELAALGISNDELRTLASLYRDGHSFVRLQVTQLSALGFYDYQ